MKLQTMHATEQQLLASFSDCSAISVSAGVEWAKVRPNPVLYAGVLMPQQSNRRHAGRRLLKLSLT